MADGFPEADAAAQAEAADAGAPGFSERAFYLREFRGRTLAVALPHLDARARAQLGPPLAELDAGGVDVLLLAADEAALTGACDGAVVRADHPRLEGEVWRALHTRRLLGVATAPGSPFAAACREVGVRLSIFKLVWIDPGGGLRRADGHRESFVHLDELRGLLASAGAGLLGPERLPLWREVAAMLEAGLPAVNVCSAEGLDDELFTYAGSGTLFTRDRYMTVRRLGLDDYDAAFDLIQRGVAEGYLARRTVEELDALLAHGFGAFVEARHLAGIGALVPSSDGRSGELAGLYTLTRFLGEGVGYSLLAHGLALARARGYGYVFACTTLERVASFFERNGFRLVGADALPADKWLGYDPERRARLTCLRKDVAAGAG